MKWDNPKKKESHPGKTLFQHVKETQFLFQLFKYFYELKNQKFLKIIEKVIEYHDFGKLHTKWSCYNGKIPFHAENSIKYLEENREIITQLHEEDIALIVYFILKHHSKITEIIKSHEYSKLGETIREYIKKNLQKKERIELVDYYGVFKICDSLSASNYVILPTFPKIKENDVKTLINGEINKERWKEQTKLKLLGNIGILRAYTGWGKTKVSPIFFVNKPIKKLFFIFPTITAINKFFNEWNNAFPNRVAKYFYFYDAELYSKNHEDIDPSITLFHSQHFLKPIIITTIDQFLLSFMQVGKYHLKRPMWRNAGIVFDEVHLLNKKMLSLLIYFLKTFLPIYNLKCLFMSATLSNGLKNFLKNMFGMRKTHELDLLEKYKDFKRVDFELWFEKYIEEDVDKIISKFKKGKRILIIVNTVKTAVEIAKKLEEYNVYDFILIHARYLYKHRKEKEDELEKKHNKPHILISTQICEVSLDISYDFLFTEAAPLPSLIQRFGRINRRCENGKHVKKVNVFIYKPRIENKRFYPYDIDEIRLCMKLLENIKIFKNEFQLIEKYNQIKDEEKINKDVEKAINELKIREIYENDDRVGFFFSLNLTEEEAINLLSYREDFTTLIIPHPEMVDDELAKKEIEKLLKEWEKSKDDKEIRRRLFSRFKMLSVNIPFYWLKEKISKEERYGLPVINIRDKIYNKNYGLISLSEVNNIW